MTDARPTGLLPPLAAGAGILMLIGAWLVPLDPATGPAGPTAAALDLPEPARPPALAELTETIRRPLFAATRRQPPAAGTEAPGNAAQLFSRYRLQGVVIDGKRRRVLLAPSQGGSVLSIAEGQVLDGWTIEKIAPESLTLRSENRVETVELGTARKR